MSALKEFVRLIKDVSREHYSTKQLTDESIEFIYNEFMALPESDRKFIVEIVFRDYLECHKPILNDRLKQRLELMNRKAMYELRSHMFTLIFTFVGGTLITLFVIHLVYTLANGDTSLLKIFQNVYKIGGVYFGG